jgi:hypothetical protein
MARWMILRHGRGNQQVEVVYENLITGLRYGLGKTSSDVTDDMIVEWIFTYGGPAYGDTIRLSDGSRLVYKAPAVGASA